MEPNPQDLDKFAQRHGLGAIGATDIDKLRKQESEALKNVPAEFSCAIVIGVRLVDAVIDQIEDRPTPLYFHLYRQANFTLDRIAYRLALELQDTGYRSIAVPASQITEPGGRRGLVSHRLLGYAAGIGWIGRPTLLVHPRYGARMRYAAVLTDAPYQPGVPMENKCGECRECMEVCPVAAIKESSREFDLDACYKKLNEFRKLSFIGQHVCGICVRACSGPKCL